MESGTESGAESRTWSESGTVWHLILLSLNVHSGSFTRCSTKVIFFVTLRTKGGRF